MAWDTTLDPSNRFVWVRVHGTLNDRELLDGDESLRNDPAFDPDFDQLIDLRAAEGSEVTSAGVQTLANRPPLFNPSAKRAIVVRTDLGFGMARMFELLREGKSGDIRVFRDFDEAKRWLGLP